jgi:oligoendopeptidase F
MGTVIDPTRWDLSKFYGGFDEEDITNSLICIKSTLIELESKSKLTILNENDLINISNLIKQIESLESFYYCLATENIKPSFLTSLNTSITTLKSIVRIIISNLQELICKMTDEQYDDWFTSISEKSFISELLKDGTKRESSQEKIISSFARETLSCLEDIYAQLRNNLKVKVVLCEENEISFAEANNLVMYHPEYSKRLFVFKELNRTLEKQSNIFASIYNQMVGIRLNEYKIKNVDYFEESLQLNGISKSTFNAMWDVVDSKLEEVSGYLKVKAKEVGKESLSWLELMTSTQKVSYQIKFSKAIEEITKSLEAIDINMSDFVKEAITKGWVDAEQRNTKPPGGFCAPFISEGESRISLNYDQSFDSARRLAHELGHAWHFQQIKDVPSLRFSEDTFEMTMAETSSIFFETVFIDYVIEDTKDFTIKKAMLGWKIEKSLNYLMSIRGAFLFENRFYANRKRGQLDVNQMEELSIQCQEKAYGNSLSEYEPFVWIKYGQFYQAGIPFYNYPYSFGFLLSIGLLEISKGNEQFSKKFQEFLCETGTMPVEHLVKKHFNKDLSQPELWQQSIQRILSDIEQFNKL